MHARVRTPEACVNWLVNEKACAGHARHDVVSCGRGAESVSTQYYHSNVQLFEMHHEKQRSCGSASVVFPPVSRKCRIKKDIGWDWPGSSRLTDEPISELGERAEPARPPRTALQPARQEKEASRVRNY